MLPDKPLEHMIDSMLDLEVDFGQSEHLASPEIDEQHLETKQTEADKKTITENKTLHEENCGPAQIEQPEGLQDFSSDDSKDLPTAKQLATEQVQIQQNDHLPNDLLQNSQLTEQQKEQAKEENTLMSGKTLEIAFNGECTIYEVAEWQNKIIQKWPDQSQSVTFDMSDVSDVDACFVQLLLSCKKTALANGAQCHISHIPAQLQERITNMHVSEIFGEEG